MLSRKIVVLELDLSHTHKRGSGTFIFQTIIPVIFISPLHTGGAIFISPSAPPPGEQNGNNRVTRFKINNMLYTKSESTTITLE